MLTIPRSDAATLFRATGAREVPECYCVHLLLLYHPSFRGSCSSCFQAHASLRQSSQFFGHFGLHRRQLLSFAASIVFHSSTIVRTFCEQSYDWWTNAASSALNRRPQTRHRYPARVSSIFSLAFTLHLYARPRCRNQGQHRCVWSSYSCPG